MKRAFLLLLAILFAVTASLRANHWTPDPTMNYTMSVTGVVLIDDVEQNNTSLEVGVFSGNECRGSGMLFNVGSRCVFMIMVYSNNVGEQLSFKLYDHTLNEELDLYCDNSLTFANEIAVGGIGNPYELEFASIGYITITANVNPVGAGTTTGDGMYQIDDEVNMTATPNDDFWFVDWTENDEVVTISNSFSFTAAVNRSFVANFKPITLHWEPIGGTQYSMTVLGVILIDGVEQNNPMLEVGAFCGDECRGSNVAYLDSLTMRYVVPLNIVSNVESGETISFRLYDHRAEEELDVLGLNPLVFEAETIVGLDGEFYHFEFGSLYMVTAIVDPDGTGYVEGTGGYYWGTTATLTAIANNGYAFWKWLQNDVMVSRDNPYSFTVTGNMEFVAKFTEQQLFELEEGWNWWSTYIEQSDIDGLGILETELGNRGVEIRSQLAFVQYADYDDTWYGNLESITNEDGYMINVSTDCTIGMPGRISNPEEHPITINPGWTWIGYPVTVAQKPSVAMSNYNATVDDIVKGQQSFAVYRNGYGWFPSNFVLVPGQGYKYHSVADQPDTLTYVNDYENRDFSIVEENLYWENNYNAYPGNFNMMAVVYVADNEQRNENLEVGAFVNGECRGSVKLEYFEPLDRYYAMLTVSGVNCENVTFKVVNANNNTMSTECENSIDFVSDAIIGTLDNPYEIRFGAMTANDGKLEIYPNPVERNHEFKVNVPQGESVSEVVITDVLGAIVDEEVLSVSGTYIIKVSCVSGNIYYGKLIVK